MDVIWHGLRDAFLMAWQVWWALVLGFAISAIVQARVPRERIQRGLGGSGPAPVARATALGAASSSCSYAAVAIGKSIFEKGASAASALAFQLASTNLVWELGLVLWVLIRWQFTLAEYLGGIVMIALSAVMVRVAVPRALEEQAREHAQAADAGHHHHHHDHGGGGAWAAVAGGFRHDWLMLWKEIAGGFLIAGFVAQFGNGFFEALFVHHAPQPLPALENVVVGPLIAVLSFVCSVGNVPLAAVLWSGGITFAGVLSFLFADLIVLPILLIYRKYYGTRYAARIAVVMLISMALAALIVSALFGTLGAIPTGPRPARAEIFGSIRINYELVLNVLTTLLFLALLRPWGALRRARACRAAPGPN